MGTPARDPSPAGACVYTSAMRSTKIVATVGPASREPAVLERMIAEGMDVARLNFAHGEPEQHAETVGRIRAAAEPVGREVAVLQDVPGPKLRIGPVGGGVCQLDNGARVVLTPERIEGDPGGCRSRGSGSRRSWRPTTWPTSPTAPSGCA